MNLPTKKQTVYILAIILTILQLFFNKNDLLPKFSLIPTNIPTPAITYVPYEKRSTKVIRVIDGDTFEIEGKIKVRYIGINTPEIYHDTTGKKTGEQCFANESFFENKRLIEGKTVTLVKDISDKDKYDRLLRYVYIDNIFVNEYLISNGYAKIMTVKPDIKMSQIFKQKEKEAKLNNLGIWKECPSSVSNGKKGQ
jgi:micrococcal nuclease